MRILSAQITGFRSFGRTVEASFEPGLDLPSQYRIDDFTYEGDAFPYEYNNLIGEIRRIPNHASLEDDFL